MCALSTLPNLTILVRHIHKIVSEYDQEIPQSQTADKVDIARLLIVQNGKMF